MTDYDDRQAAELYADPAQRGGKGPLVPAQANRRLSSHVPVRFDPRTIELVKRVATQDGMTVSAWVRKIVHDELRRRVPEDPETDHERPGTMTVSYRRGVDQATDTGVPTGA